MNNYYDAWQVLVTLFILVLPLALLGIAAIKWGVYTSGANAPTASLEV